MIKAVHIEDEPRNIELLENLIATHCSHEVQLMGNAKNIQDAIELIKRTQPQLVYLDIELNQGNAFELLEQLSGYGFQVIFITAYNDYAIKAFRLNAVDYLLKPISIEELKDATTKAVNRIKQQSGNDYVQELIKQLKLNNGVQKIGIPVNDGVLFINADEIIKAEANSSYTNVYLEGNKIITASKNLKEIELLLPANSFLRVHNSWIINTKHLRKYFRGKNGYVELEDGTTVPVSQRKKGSFLDLYGE